MLAAGLNPFFGEGRIIPFAREEENVNINPCHVPLH